MRSRAGAADGATVPASSLISSCLRPAILFIYIYRAAARPQLQSNGRISFFSGSHACVCVCVCQRVCFHFVCVCVCVYCEAEVCVRTSPLLSFSHVCVSFATCVCVCPGASVSAYFFIHRMCIVCLPARPCVCVCVWR